MPSSAPSRVRISRYCCTASLLYPLARSARISIATNGLDERERDRQVAESTDHRGVVAVCHLGLGPPAHRVQVLALPCLSCLPDPPPRQSGKWVAPLFAQRCAQCLELVRPGRRTVLRSVDQLPELVQIHRTRRGIEQIAVRSPHQPHRRPRSRRRLGEHPAKPAEVGLKRVAAVPRDPMPAAVSASTPGLDRVPPGSLAVLGDSPGLDSRAFGCSPSIWSWA